MLSEENKKLDFENEYRGSTKNVIMSVLLKKADAGVTLGQSLERESQDVRGQLRTLVKSRDIPSHPLCAHPRVPEAIREMVSKAVLAIAETQEGKVLMNQVRIPSPTVADYDRDYKPLEEIDVKYLSNWGK